MKKDNKSINLKEIKTSIELTKMLEKLTPLQFAEVTGRIKGMVEANKLNQFEK